MKKNSLDLQEQLRNLFPEHSFEAPTLPEPAEFWLQDEPLLCKFEKRNGKPITLIQGYNGSDADLKKLTKALQKHLGVGGSFKDESIIIQGNYRDAIMDFLKAKGFQVKRVGG